MVVNDPSMHATKTRRVEDSAKNVIVDLTKGFESIDARHGTQIPVPIETSPIRDDSQSVATYRRSFLVTPRS